MLAMIGLRKGAARAGLSSIFDEFGIDRASTTAEQVQSTCNQLPRQPPRPGHADSVLELPHLALRRRRRRPRPRRRARRPGRGWHRHRCDVRVRSRSSRARRQERAHAHHPHPVRPSQRPGRNSSRSPVRGCARRRLRPWSPRRPTCTTARCLRWRRLLVPSDQRPASFVLGSGQGAFTFDTRLPGNRNTGHEFGTRLGADEKRDLIAFLQSL